MKLKNFFLTAAREAPGRVYSINNGVESTFFRRSRGNIYSIAFSPSGVLYFVNANEFKIYRVFRLWNWQLALSVYTHNTYVRDVAFDSNGALYFSESSGAKADGRIYRLNGSVATPFLDIPLAAVGGFWAGDFAFDAQNTLYISSGNNIPSSMWRREGSGWVSVYNDPQNPLKGMALLADGLVACANWHYAIQVLDLHKGTRDLVYSNPAHLWVSDVALRAPEIEIDTRYEGNKVYSCDGMTCWREDSTVMASTGIFPDKDAQSTEIGTLLASIGAPTGPTANDQEIWSRTQAVWTWMQCHGVNPGDPNYDAINAYRMGLSAWPSIGNYAHMFVTWGGFAWGSGCTCMCRSQAFATLLYRVGIPIDRMAIAETRWASTYSQHMFIVLQIGGRWYRLDAESSLPNLPAAPADVEAVSVADYDHPVGLSVIPGSSLTRAMWVR